MTKLRPILKYHGGKWRLAPWIIKNLPEHHSYVEPFCGAASVLLRKPKSPVEVLNDLNGRLVSLFKVLQQPEEAKRLKELILNTPYAIAEYLEAREVHEDPVEDARRVLILGHQGHGSTAATGGKLTGWRRGLRNARKRSSADEWADIHGYIEAWRDRLRGVFLESQCAFRVINQWDRPETLFYVDPPYVASTRHGPGNEGYGHEFTDQQHIELAQQLNEVKGMVVLSGYNSEIYDDLYKGWIKIEKEAMADRGKHAVECLWISPNSVKSQPTLFYLT